MRKWNVYERARYIVHLKETQGYSIQDIQSIIGDRRNSAKKTYVCYRLIELIEEYDDSFDTKGAKENFSFLQLATGQQHIREYIGLPMWNDISDENIDQPLPSEKREHLKNLFLCLFDSGQYRSLIRESRDITAKLSKIMADPDAIRILLEEQNIELAFENIGGQAQALNTFASKSKNHVAQISGELVTFKYSSPSSCEAKEDLAALISDIKVLADDIAGKLGK